MSAMFLAVSVLAISIISTTANEERPLVTTKLGPVEGLWRTSYDGRKYAAFEGVPYAKPPVGELRFEESQPVEAWPGVWNATQQYMCPQADISEKYHYLGDEDCLYLNIYVPQFNSPKNLDVVVHIHGGCFMWGYNKEFLGDKHFMDRDLILVSMNYRLNVFGFLSTEDEVVPGNNGLKDQRLALKWIQENIASFGGNPNSITLTGFSAGGASVQYHYLSPGSRGLFHRGMSTSGSALAPWAFQEKPTKLTKILAKVVGCDFRSSVDKVSCLKTRPVRLLLDNMVNHVYPMYPFPVCPYAPVLEKGGNNPFLTQTPFNLLKNGKVADVPWINSYTTDEGLASSLAYLDSVDDIINSWSDVFPYLAETYEIMPEGSREEVGKKIWDFYVSKAKGRNELFDQLTKMSTDRLVSVPNEKSAEMQSKAIKSPVYFYVFDFHGNHSFKYAFHKNPPAGVCHGDDMVYLFGGLIKKPLSETEIKMKNVLMDFLESYASSGVPTLQGVPLEPIRDKFIFYKISGPDDIQKQIKTDYSANDFWSSLGLLEHENLWPRKDEL